MLASQCINTLKSVSWHTVAITIQQKTVTQSRDVSLLPSISAILKATHFGPSVGVTAFAGLLAFYSGLRSEILLLVPAVLFGQFSVGWCNDYLDSDRDIKAGRSEKPIVEGTVNRTTLKYLSIWALGVSLVLSFVLIQGFGLTHTLALISAFLYNIRLKSSPLSIAIFLISFGALPVAVAQASASPFAPQFWIIGASALLGAAIHSLNVAPEFEVDAKTDIKGTVHYFSFTLAILTGALLASTSVVLVAPAVYAQAGNLTKLVFLLYVFVSAVFVFFYAKKNHASALKSAMLMSLLAPLALLCGAPFMRGQPPYPMYARISH